MPDDLLRYLSGPTPYSPLWLWIAVLLLVAVIAWAASVFVWTMPPARLRTIPVLRDVHRRVVQRHFTRTVKRIRADHHAGRLPAPHAAAAISRALRSYLYVATGDRAQYMHVGDIAAGRLAPAAPLVAALDDVRFSTAPEYDVDALAHAAGEMIRTWT